MFSWILKFCQKVYLMMPIFILLININLRQNGIPTDSRYKIQFLKLYLVKNTVCMYYKRGPSKRKQQNMKNEIFNLNWMNLSLVENY